MLLDCVRSQVESALAEIRRIEGSEFPYHHTEECLRETKTLFLGHHDALHRIGGSASADKISYICNQAAGCVRDFTELLGFLLRSINIRNAFEAYGPLLRLSTKILGPSTRLVISSEWHSSPFTFLGYEHLAETVMIGLPATESSNPFLLPLVGHELGHNAWDYAGMDSEMSREVAKRILSEIRTRWTEFKPLFPASSPDDIQADFFNQSIWGLAWSWALRQCEEYYCDFMGAYLFGEAYLYAFAYMLASVRTGGRSKFYPNMKVRAAKLAEVAREYDVPVPEDYTYWFDDLDGIPTEHQRESTLLALADRVANLLVPTLADRVQSFLQSKSVDKLSPESIQPVLDRFQMNSPAAEAGGLRNILNAAWKARIDPRAIGRQSHDSDSLKMLSEIVLKSIEIDEIEDRLPQSR